MNSRACCLTVAVTLAGVSPAVAQGMVPDIGGRVFGIVGGSLTTGCWPLDPPDGYAGR